MRKLTFVWMLALFASSGWAQETFPRNDVKDQREGAYAFNNATIVADFQTVVNNGLMLIRDGKIEYVGAAKAIPAGYTTIDVSGKSIYPSLIDIYTNYGVPKAERSRRNRNSPEQINSKTQGAYNANQAIKAEYSAAENFTIDAKKAKELRALGFGTVNTFRADGLSRGTSAFVTLGEDSDNNVLLDEHAAAHYSLTKGSSTQAYPVSQMGFVATLRQTYLDAKWYASQNPRPFKDQTLEHWLSSQSLPQIFDTGDYLGALRADRIGDEFGVQYIIKGSGDEYKRLDLIKAMGADMIIPVNFPVANDVEDPIATLDVSLADMKHWELAPTNPGRLSDAGVSFAFTSANLKKSKDFWPNIRKAIKYGLSEEEALKALTYTPAKMVRSNGQVGSLAKGKLANFIITSDNLFSKKNIIHENWVQGKRFSLKPLDVADNSGTYKLTVASTNYNVEISGVQGKQKSKIIVNDSTKVDLSAKFKNEIVTASFKPEGEDGLIRLSGWKVENGWKGNGQLADGKWVNWTLSRTGDVESKKKGDKSKKKDEIGKLGEVIYPFVAYGNTSLPQQQTILIKNATVWTSDKEGILEGTDVLLKDGKIAKIGKNLTETGAVVVDGTGKHLTPGIIDEHSHVGGGGNDIATNSGMVRIGDQINPDQINIYRALAGGVTALQVLHGSANPIGGQSALIKLRWGESPENIKIKGADEFIKFALGENVKRSRSQSSIRYPQSRMGVEQVYMDAFSSAKEYEKKWQAYNSLSKKEKPKATAPRRDLADEAMLEIINEERFITCHSYVQSEINMLMNVADKFDFKVNTFTHILEGYKVADRMKEHGAAASTFSDWWAYKWEVRYAIPYNAAIMHNAGVLVAINSDDANQMRRLNQEVAKSVKYGGMSEEDVFDMITINPAKMLHLDDHMGSITIGKDADVVLWSGHPLSVYTIAEKTIIDGTVYYDLEKDQASRDYIATERARLIQKMKGVKKAGKPTRKGGSKQLMEFHCEDEIQASDFDLMLK
jgi:imidazolonepropionase-like amidohydrolase